MKNLLNKISSFIFLNGESSAERTEADILVSSQRHKLANVKVETIKTKYFFIYQLKVDGEVIREMKYENESGKAGQLMCVLKYKIQKKEPYLFSAGMNLDDLYQTIKKEYKPFKTLKNG
jgi:hypothetical protein